MHRSSFAALPGPRACSRKSRSSRHWSSIINGLSRLAADGGGGQDPFAWTARPSAAPAALRRPPASSASVYFSSASLTAASAAAFVASPTSRTPPSSNMPMASYPYSPESSDATTPRSISPSSVASGRTSRTSVSNQRMSLSGRRLASYNPMSSVDIAAIEEAMKTAALDQHRGYAKDSYGEIQQANHTEYVSKTNAAGYQIIREPLWNRGMPQSSAVATKVVHRRSPSTQLRVLPLSLLTVRPNTRPVLHTRGTRSQEPHWPPASRHGEPTDAMCPCHEYGPDPPDSH